MGVPVPGRKRERPHRCGLPGRSDERGMQRTPVALARSSALAGLETRVRLADHEDLAATTNDLAVAVTGLRRLQGGQDLHDKPRKKWLGQNKPAILAGVDVADQVLAGPRALAGLEWPPPPGACHDRRRQIGRA